MTSEEWWRGFTLDLIFIFISNIWILWTEEIPTGSRRKRDPFGGVEGSWAVGEVEGGPGSPAMFWLHLPGFDSCSKLLFSCIVNLCCCATRQWRCHYECQEVLVCVTHALQRLTMISFYCWPDGCRQSSGRLWLVKYELLEARWNDGGLLQPNVPLHSLGCLTLKALIARIWCETGKQDGWFLSQNIPCCGARWYLPARRGNFIEFGNYTDPLLFVTV